MKKGVNRHVDGKFTASYDRVIVCVCLFRDYCKNYTMFIKIITTQKRTIQLEGNF